MTEVNKDAQAETVPSPCIGVCVVDDKTKLCQGCYRTLDEIQDWWDLDNDKQKAITEVASQREAAQFD